MKFDHIQQEQVAAIVTRIQEAANSNWVIGEQAHIAKQNHGMTDEALAEMTGVDRVVITQSRTVWEKFRDCNSSYKVSWTHFRAAVAWEDAEHWLRLASETDLSVKEMQKVRALRMPADAAATESSGEQQSDTETTENAPTAEQPKRRGPKKSRATPAPETAAKASGGKKSEPEKAKSTGQPSGGNTFNPQEWEDDDEPVNIEQTLKLIDETIQRLAEPDDCKRLAKRFRTWADKLDPPQKRKQIPPQVEDVAAYCKERQNAVDPQQWWDFYQSKNWMVGKNKMADWQAAVRTWENPGRTGEKSNGRIRIKGGELDNWIPDEDFTQ